MLTIFYTRQEFSLGGTVTVQCVGDDHAGHVGEALEQLTKESLGGLLVPPALHESREEMSVLIDRAPAILALTPKGKKHFSHVPRVSGARLSSPKLIRICRIASDVTVTPGATSSSSTSR